MVTSPRQTSKMMPRVLSMEYEIGQVAESPDIVEPQCGLPFRGAIRKCPSLCGADDSPSIRHFLRFLHEFRPAQADHYFFAKPQMISAARWQSFRLTSRCVAARRTYFARAETRTPCEASLSATSRAVPTVGLTSNQ